MTKTAAHDGPGVVVTLYFAVVTLAAVMGFVVGLFLGGSLDPIAILGLLEVPPSPFGFALYGSVTVAVALGLPLVLIMFVSRRLSEPAVES